MEIEERTVREIADVAEKFREKHEEPKDSSEMVLGSEEAQEKLMDYLNDPLRDELKSLITGLSDQEKAELSALAWVGRGDNPSRNFEDWVEYAKGFDQDNTFNYLSGIANLGGYLEEGLGQLKSDTS